MSEKIDQELFNAFRSGSEEARNKVWTILWNKLYTSAVMICGGYKKCADDGFECVNDGFQDAIIELDKEVKKGPSFKITKQSLENLKSERVTDDVLKKLENIKNQEVTEEEKFVNLLKKTIGGEQTVKFKSLILEHAKKEVVFRDEDSFYSYVRRKICLRCLDKLREKERRWDKITSLDEFLVGQDGDNESIPYHEIVRAYGETPEEEVINNERVKTFLEGFYSIRDKLPKGLRDIIDAGLKILQDAKDAEEPDIKRKDLWKKVCEELNISENAINLRKKRLRAIDKALYGSTLKS